jgi:hypothetical protein
MDFYQFCVDNRSNGGDQAIIGINDYLSDSSFIDFASFLRLSNNFALKNGGEIFVIDDRQNLSSISLCPVFSFL